MAGEVLFGPLEALSRQRPLEDPQAGEILERDGVALGVQAIDQLGATEAEEFEIAREDPSAPPARGTTARPQAVSNDLESARRNTESYERNLSLVLAGYAAGF